MIGIANKMNVNLLIISIFKSKMKPVLYIRPKKTMCRFFRRDWACSGDFISKYEESSCIQVGITSKFFYSRIQMNRIIKIWKYELYREKNFRTIYKGNIDRFSSLLRIFEMLEGLTETKSWSLKPISSFQ